MNSEHPAEALAKELTVESDVGVATVLGNSGLLRQILWILIQNAIRQLQHLNRRTRPETTSCLNRQLKRTLVQSGTSVITNSATKAVTSATTASTDDVAGVPTAEIDMSMRNIVQGTPDHNLTTTITNAASADE